MTSLGTATTGPSSKHRPVFREKTAYVIASNEERFIVPLLREAVEHALALHARPGGIALDAGCGGQPFRHAIEHAGMRYLSMDAVAQPGISTDFVCALDGQLPAALGDGPRFDLILCTEVMEHVADWSVAWNNLSKMLAPGGKLILTCPFFYPLHEEPYDFFRPTLHAIAYWAGRVGLEAVELRRLGTPWDVLGTAIAATGAAPADASPFSWLIGTLARKKRKLAIWMLDHRVFQRRIKVKDTLYLGNFALLVKPHLTTTPTSSGSPDQAHLATRPIA